MALHAGAVTAELELEKKKFEDGIKSALKDLKNFKKQAQKETNEIKDNIKNSTRASNSGTNVTANGVQTVSSTNTESNEIRVLTSINEGIKAIKNDIQQIKTNSRNILNAVNSNSNQNTPTNQQANTDNNTGITNNIEQNVVILKKDIKEIRNNSKKILTKLSSSASSSNTPQNNNQRTGNSQSDLGKILRDTTQIKALNREVKNSINEINQNVKKINVKIRDKKRDKNAEKVQMLNSITKRVRNIESVLRQVKNTLNGMDTRQTRQNRRNSSSSGNTQTINITGSNNILQGIDRNTKDTSTSADQILKQVRKIAREVQQGNRDQREQTQAIEESVSSSDGGGGGLIGAVGAALPGVGLAMTAASKESVLSQFQIQTGASEEEMEAFSKSIDNVAKKGVGAIDEVALAMSIVRRETGFSGEELENATSKALMFQEKMDWDTKESTRAIGSMMKNYNMSYEDATDLILKTAQVAGDDADDLLDTFWEYAPQVKEMGISPEQFANYLAVGAESGVYNFDKIGDVLKEAQLKITGGGKSTIETLQALGFNYDQVLANLNAGGETAQKQYDEIFKRLGQVEDQSLKKAYAFEIAGAPGEDVGMAYFNQLAKGENLIGDFSGTSDKALETFEEDFATQWQGFVTELQLMFEPLGMEIISALKDLLPLIKPFIEQLTKLFQHPAIGEFIAGLIMGITAVFGIIVPIVSFIKNLSFLITVIKGVVGVISTLVGILGGPVTLVILGVIALIVGLYFAIKNNFLGIQDFLKDLIDYFKDGYDKLADFVKDFIELWKKKPSDAIKLFVNTTKRLFSPIITFFSNSFDSIYNLIEKIVNKIKEKFNEVQYFFEYLKFSIQQTLYNIIYDATNFLSDLVFTIYTKITEAWQTVVDFGGKMFNAGKNLIQNIIDGIKSIINKPKELIAQALNLDSNAGFFENLGNAAESIKNGFNGAFNESVNYEGVASISSTNVEPISNHNIGEVHINVDGGNPDNIIRVMEDYFYDAERSRAF